MKTSYLNFRLVAGLIGLCLFALLGFVYPLFLREDPMNWNQYPNNLPISGEHWLGTTSLGQSTFKLLSVSVHNSVLIGLFVAFFATLIGVFVGLMAGFIGGVPDRLITLLTDSFIVIPSLPILILLSSLVRGTAPVFYISLVLIIFNWPWPARQVRSMVLSIKEQDFVSTAYFAGQRRVETVWKEIFPFIATWAVANFINTILVAIATESGLAVIGLGSNETPTLGSMIYWANQHQAMLGGKWLWIGAPVVAMALLFISLFMVTTGFQMYAAKKRGKDA